LDHARRKVEAGSAPKIEIVRAEAGLAGRLEDVINAETSVRDRERELKRILNRDDLPLGNRAAQARLRRARLEKVRDQTDRDRLRQSIRQEVYNAVDELRKNWRRILAAEQGVVTAYRDYRVEQSQFQLGKRTSTDVLLSASRLADAQSRRIRAFAEYEIAQVRLARATGTLLGLGRLQIR
jgi:outer membrane protein